MIRRLHDQVAGGVWLDSARSILAEAIMEREGQGKFRAFSAGSFPKGAVHPMALHTLELLHYDISRFRSKSWDEFAGPDAPHMDFIITVCDNAAGEVCPVWPGKPVSAHWGLPDPAAATGSEAEIAAAFQQCYGQLHHRISLFAALPIASLEQVALKHELDAIGRSVKQ
jgi:protein-tyrosine-phosphatase